MIQCFCPGAAGLYSLFLSEWDSDCCCQFDSHDVYIYIHTYIYIKYMGNIYGQMSLECEGAAEQPSSKTSGWR